MAAFTSPHPSSNPCSNIRQAHPPMLAWPHEVAITPSQPCNIHVNTHFFHIYLHENPAPHHLSMPRFRSPHVHPASASSSTNVGFNSSTQLACYGSFAAATSRMLSANELSLNGQIPTDKALHAPTKATVASSPPTPGRYNWACPRWRGRLTAWTNSEDLRRRLSHLRFLLHSLPEVKKKSTWLKGPKRK
uniref:Uncharacterized protein n=1 Tax=Vitis vinifera TaxID=29760 RepID=F6HSZ6_VITVI